MPAEAVGDRADALDLAIRRPAQGGLEDVGLRGEVPGGRGQRDVGLGGDAPVADGGDALARDDARRSRRRSPRGPVWTPRRAWPVSRARPKLPGTFVLANRVRYVLGSPRRHDPSPLPLVARSSASPAAPRCCARSAARRSTSSAPGGLREGRRGRRARSAGRAAAARPGDPADPAAARRHPARVLDPGRDRALGDHADRAATTGTTARLGGPQRLHRLRLPPDDARVRRLRGSVPDDPRPDADAPRSATCSSCTSATPTRKLRQAVTMHPHGVKYNPEYDGAYMGEYTRAGGFIAPGRVVHLPVGVHAGLGRRLAVPRPRPQPHAQHVPRPVRLDHRPPARARSSPTASTRSSPTSCRRRSPACTRNFHCINGRAYAGNTPTLKARVGEDVEIHAFGMDYNFHTFHIHGHRWRDPAGTFTDNPAMGPTNPSRPASSKTTPVAGCTTATSSRIRTRAWRAGTSSTREPEERRVAHPARRHWPAAALLAPAAASAQSYPEPQQPGPVAAKPKGPHKTYTVCKKKRCDFRTIQKAVDKARGRRHGPRQATASTARP